MPPLPLNPGNTRVKNAEDNTALMVAARDGDLARVQELLGAPGHKAARLDLSNKYGWRAVHYAAKEGHLEILNALAAAGANINIQTKKRTTPLGVAVFYNKRPIVQRLIELGADVNAGDIKSKPIWVALGIDTGNQFANRILYLISADVIEAGATLDGIPDFRIQWKIEHILRKLNNYLDDMGAPENDVFLDSITKLLRLLLEKKTALIIDHLNDRKYVGHPLDVPRVYISMLLAESDDVPLMRTALENGLVLVHPGQPANQNPIIYAQEGRFTPEMNALILEFAPPPPAPPPPPPPAQMWKGWTRADLDMFNSVFVENAYNFSICPVCFKFSERADGCMYMHHNCLEEQRLKGGFVHKELYEKYKSRDQFRPEENGLIWWCTVCGRICNSHYHYDLLPPFVEHPTYKIPGFDRDPFGNDCRGPNNGGGLPEKVARYRRAREFALELQGQIDQITEEEAMKQLVEEMWVAPIARYERRAEKILQEGRYNIPNTNFPLPVANAAPAANNAPAPNINRPQANRNDPALRPEIVQDPDMMNVMTMNNIPRGIKFHHRKPNGAIYHHEAPIGRPGFISWFGGDGGMAKNFADARFGHCFDVDCGAILYPQELEPFVDTAEEERFIPRDLFEIYRANFNRHMPARLAAGAAPGAGHGGSKRIQKTRKVKGNKRKQRGGQPHNMFIELETGQCLLPRKAKGGAHKKHRKTKRKNRR